MINGLISVLVIFVILAVGFSFTWKSLWPADTNKVFSVTVVKIAAPALAVVSIESHFTPEIIRESVFHLALIAASLMLMRFLGLGLARLLKMEKKKKAVFITTFTFNNSMFIGLPINQIVFGDEGLPYLFIFYFVTISVFWSLGNYTLEKASGGPSSFSLKKFFSPGLIGVLIGALLVELQIAIPPILDLSLGYLGQLCVPLSLLVIGSNLARTMKQGMPRITVDQLLILIGKFVIHPACIYLIFSFIGVTGLPLKVFILTAALPCHAQTAILADYYDVEGEYAANLVSLSTFVSLFTIPIYATVLL